MRCCAPEDGARTACYFEELGEEAPDAADALLHGRPRGRQLTAGGGRGAFVEGAGGLKDR
jgi:hypothetical protein